MLGERCSYTTTLDPRPILALVACSVCVGRRRRNWLIYPGSCYCLINPEDSQIDVSCIVWMLQNTRLTWFVASHYSTSKPADLLQLLYFVKTWHTTAAKDGNTTNTESHTHRVRAGFVAKATYSVAQHEMGVVKHPSSVAHVANLENKSCIVIGWRPLK